MSIYHTDRMEYVYVIRHKKTGRKYVGCRYAKNCHPSELFVSYFTSSNKIKKRIREEGIDAFEILEIIECPENNAFDVETDFLVKNKCAELPEWFNESKNNFRRAEGKLPTREGKNTLENIETGERREFPKGERPDGWKTLNSGKSNYFCVEEPSVVRKLRKDDPLVTSGKFRHINSGFAIYELNNKKVRLRVDDERVLSGEAIGIAAKREVSDDVRGRMSNAKKGKIWMMKGENMKIANSIEESQHLIEDGWVRGRVSPIKVGAKLDCPCGKKYNTREHKLSGCTLYKTIT